MVSAGGLRLHGDSIQALLEGLTRKRERQIWRLWIASAILAVLLVWLVIAKSIVAYLASVAPETALSLAPNDPEALLNIAEKRLTERLESARQAQDRFVTRLAAQE